MLKLAELRKEKGLTQLQLAIALDMSVKKLAAWEQERSQPCIEDICLLADYFQCSVDELLGREDYGTGNVVIQGAQLSAFDERLLQVVHLLPIEDQYQVLGFAQALAK